MVEVKCHFHSILSRVRSIEVDLDHQAEVVFVCFHHCTVTLLYRLVTLCSLEGTHYAQPSRKEWRVTFHLLEDQISA